MKFINHRFIKGGSVIYFTPAFAVEWYKNSGCTECMIAVKFLGYRYIVIVAY